MMRGRYEKPSLRKFPLIPVIFILILAVTVVILLLKGCDSIPTIIPGNEADSTAASVEKNPDSIAIPGYEMLELKAGSKEQSLCMPNPPQNCCYFQICLYLEDGTLLWQSELIEPGTNSKPIVLSKTLEKGMYPNAILRYSCYRMDESLAPLNGAETKLTLWVK
jgi:hypothetical protein